MKEHKYSSRTVSFQHTYSATHMGKGKKKCRAQGGQGAFFLQV
jgi:hypothetical protein